MAAFRCPQHGMQIAGHFCEHAGLAIDERRPIDVYLQRFPYWGWFTLCDACARGRDIADIEENVALVCEECVADWARVTNSDYLRRCQNPKPEFPAE